MSTSFRIASRRDIRPATMQADKRSDPLLATPDFVTLAQAADGSPIRRAILKCLSFSATPIAYQHRHPHGSIPAVADRLAALLAGVPGLRLVVVGQHNFGSSRIELGTNQEDAWRQVSRLLAFEDAVDIVGAPSPNAQKVIRSEDRGAGAAGRWGVKQGDRPSARHLRPHHQVPRPPMPGAIY